MGDLVPHIRVVAAVIEQQGRFLITQRRLTGVLAGLWEFPIGKVDRLDVLAVANGPTHGFDA